MFAHAAVTDVNGRKLWHDQRIAREAFDLVAAAPGDTRVRLRDWSLERQAAGYHAQIPAGDFALDLRCAPTQPVLLQGNQGLSRKGPQPEQASYYYSRPQLAVTGALSLQGRRFEVAGKAWLDHEWSQELLHPQAVGWDWIGMNLEDGSALTAFRLRRQDGSSLWDGGSFRTSSGVLHTFSPGEVVFQRAAPVWTSPLSTTRRQYPVETATATASAEVDRAHARGLLHRLPPGTGC